MTNKTKIPPIARLKKYLIFIAPDILSWRAREPSYFTDGRVQGAAQKSGAWNRRYANTVVAPNSSRITIMGQRYNKAAVMDAMRWNQKVKLLKEESAARGLNYAGIGDHDQQIIEQRTRNRKAADKKRLALFAWMMLLIIPGCVAMAWAIAHFAGTIQ